jgi:hypothetical protein
MPADMEPRRLIAYALMLAMALAFAALWLHLTRERRADRRSWRLYERGRKVRQKARATADADAQT